MKLKLVLIILTLVVLSSIAFADEKPLCSIPIDVMLVIDRSGSMTNPDPQRLQDAKDAAVTFVNQMNFSQDTAGLASFATSASLDRPLTSNKNDVINSINALTAGGATYMGEGIRLARVELESYSVNTPSIVLLSDGAPNVWPGPIQFCNVQPSSPTNCTIYAVNQSNLAKDAGIEVFAIGLGVTNFTEEVLKDIATDDNHYYFAPNSSDLEDIYLNISQEICPCGDGNLDPGEECDDGNLVNGDGCNAYCVEEFCGDYIQNDGPPGGLGEECDDGPSGSNLCTPDCELTECGDFIQQAPNGYGQSEECDDGPSGSNQCTPQCSLTFCGDYTPQDPNGYNESEECDDGPSGSSACTVDCTLTYCGDYTQQDPNGYGFYEECDDGPSGSNVCTENCTLTYCGDNIVQNPNGQGQSEECDDGNLVNGDGCNEFCLEEECGNGVHDVGEECDDGDLDNTDWCNTDCELTECGDFIQQDPNGYNESEECDDGPSGSNLCTPDCTLTFCGDYTPQDPNGNNESEECDDGPSGSSACTINCSLTYCGDFVEQDPNGYGFYEECDDGPSGSSSCTVNCTLTFCGDFVEQDPNGYGQSEECDDGPSGSNLCTDTCTLTYCGDYETQNPNGQGESEECDDGPGGSNLCHSNCKLTSCGDYVTQQPNGYSQIEECDDGPSGSSACTPNCKLTTCGDYVTQQPNGYGQSEECDDGPSGSNQCTAQCTLTFCGDYTPQDPNGYNESEECDDGPSGSSACTVDCTLTYCGDYTQQDPNGYNESEECDDGPSGSSACTVNCTLTYCGDFVEQDPNGYGQSEQCDDGLSGSDQCTSNCEYTVCGDGIQQEPNGLGQYEECDGIDGVPEGYVCNEFCELLKIPECDDIDYLGPYHNNGTNQWIDTVSEIEITEDGEDICADPEDEAVTYYKDNYLQGEFELFCQTPEGCDTWLISSYEDPSWQPYLGPFPAGEESCHVIETYTELLGVKSNITWDCVYVDKSAPDPIKEVGGPKAAWNGSDGELGNPYYPEAPDHCASHDCWRVTTMTPITMSCEDPEPHPSGEYLLCFWVDFDGTDITEDECSEVGGLFNYTGDGSCCSFDEQVELYFDETTYHKLSFYCEDNVEKRSEPDVEYFKVEESKFEIELNFKWNLISVPFVLLDNSIEEILDVEGVLSVWGYDAITDKWFVYTPDGDDGNDNLDTLDPGKGYWVLTNQSGLIVIGGSLFNPAATPASIPIKGNAWNLIGYYGIDGQLGYYGPAGNGDQAGCHLASIDENVRGWSALVSYWEPLNPYQWNTHHQYPYPGEKGINEYDYLDPGAGYWVFAQDGDVFYSPSTVCNQAMEE